MTVGVSTRGPVLYLITCGSPAARGVPDFVRQAQGDGWRVCVVPTPMGANFLDVDALADLTGFPVRTTYKAPEEPDVLPPADAFVVAPATFNTVNKLAHGITDTLAVGLVCEAMGYGRPIIVAPGLNRALASNAAYGRSVRLLQEDGARLVLTDITEPGEPPATDESRPFPWERVREELEHALTQVNGREANEVDSLPRT